MRRMYHQEIGGGHTVKHTIIVNAAEIAANEYEIMALRDDGEELECITLHNEAYVKQAFDDMLVRYLEPLQKAVFDAGLIPGGRYTLFYLNDFGFPVAQKITFECYKFTTFAQHSDVAILEFKPYRKQKSYRMTIYGRSFAIFKGWQDYSRESYTVTDKSSENIEYIRTKYACFDARFFDDGIKVLKDPVMIFKDYKTGVNGKIFA